MRYCIKGGIEMNIKKYLSLFLMTCMIFSSILFSKTLPVSAATTSTPVKSVSLGENKIFENNLANYLVKNKGKTYDSSLNTLAHNAFNSDQGFAINKGKYFDKYASIGRLRFDGWVYDPNTSINSLIGYYINKMNIPVSKNIGVYVEFYKDNNSQGVIRVKGVIIFAAPSSTLKNSVLQRNDLANILFNNVSNYRQKKGLGVLKKVNTYDNLAMQYLLSKIDKFSLPSLVGVKDIYTETYDLNTLLNSPTTISSKWKGTNICSVQVFQYNMKYYVVFIVKK